MVLPGMFRDESHHHSPVLRHLRLISLHCRIPVCLLRGIPHPYL